jgi:hypothetical protein
MQVTGIPMFALFVEPEVPVEPLRFDSKNPGIGSRLQTLEPEPDSWRFRVESNLENRDSLRGLTISLACRA